MTDNRRTVWGWIKDAASTLLLVTVFFGGWLAGSAFPQPGQDLIKRFSPVAEERASPEVTSYAPPPGIILAGAPTLSPTNGQVFTGVF